MRVLQVGQLPKEMGGNYTTGVARVVGELSRYKFGENEVYLFATNISNENAQKLHSEFCTYLGYVKRPFHMISFILMHPIESVKAYKTYRITDKSTSFLHMEFIRDNFSRVIGQVKPDIIHYHGTALSAMYFANLNRNIPILYSPHAMVWADNENDEEKKKQIIKTTQLILSFADRYTALNKSVLERMLLLNIDKQRISIVPNGVDSKKFFYSETARKEIRNAFGVTDDTIVFTSVGLVIDRKGQFDFLKILQSSGINYQYWIIGKGPDENLIRQYVEENVIQERVKLLGYIEDKEIYKYHSAADFYAHASYFEAQALSEIEAYSCGLRVVVNKVIADTVGGGANVEKQTYFVLDFEKPEYKDLRNWMKLGEGERVSRNNLDWERVAEEYGKSYTIKG